MGNSFYIQLAPYILVEYTYGDSTTQFLSSQVKLAKIKNSYLGNVNFLNVSSAELVTQNVLDTTAVNLGGYKWAFLDKDVPVPYINTDSNLTYTDLSGIFTSLYVTYDRVRLHFVSGYHLEDIQGLITQVYVKEAQTAKQAIFANNVYLNSDSRDILNPKPIFLGDRMYDRYIEFMVPSLKEANRDFYSNPTNSVSIGYQYSSNNRGFLYESAIYIKVYEIGSIEKKNGNLFFYTSDIYEINVNQEDIYSLLSANITEATDGDYFLYYPTYAGNYVEDFISELNSSGGNYVIINDIDIYEQVGLDSIPTFSFTQIQESGFDVPLEFRPIVKYAESAVAFSVDYTVRIYNRENGFQIIRKASVTSFSPKKYGKHISKIALSEPSYPMAVYNKIIGGSNVTFNNAELNLTGFNTVYVPVFYDSKLIVTQVKSVLAQGADPTSPDFGNSIFFGQGDVRIYLSDFEAYFKFLVNQMDPKTGYPKKFDLSTGTVQIAFRDTSGNVLKYPSLDSTAESSKTDGELVFKIPGTVRKKVLASLTSLGNFHLISTTSGIPDTILYTGSVDNIENINKESQRLKDLANTLTTTTSTVTASTTSTVTTEIPSAQISKPPILVQPSIIEILKETNTEAVKNIIAKEEVQPPVIPGFSSDTNAISVKTGITPVAKTSTSVSRANILGKMTTQVTTDPITKTSIATGLTATGAVMTKPSLAKGTSTSSS